MADLTFTPFTLSIDEAELDDLGRRLRSTRLPDQLPDQPWVYGTDRETLEELCRYWAEEYDWRAAEAEINPWPQFLTTIDGEQVHLVHVRSETADAVPLLLTHGWPGSIVEFLHLIEPLTSPGGGEQAFHLVIPSLPGFGLSGPTTTTGVGPARIAGMWAELMAGLGYDRYVAQGGDWGAVITGHLGAIDPEHCAGIHLNMVTAGPPADGGEPTEEERAILAAGAHFRDHETGYQAIQGTKPQTLAYALADSPAGQCAWILEKFRTWSDLGANAADAAAPDAAAADAAAEDVFAVHDRDRFLTNVMLYWLTNTGGSSARIYYEHRAGGRGVASGVTVPMGGAIFPAEIYRASRRWADAAFNVVHWSTFDAGGHFAALERPADLTADIRAFVDRLDV